MKSTQEINQTLELCPHCGCKAELVISSCIKSEEMAWHKIVCKNADCGAEMGVVISRYQSDYWEAVTKLIERWNRRVWN